MYSIYTILKVDAVRCSYTKKGEAKKSSNEVLIFIIDFIEINFWPTTVDFKTLFYLKLNTIWIIDY